MDHRTIDDIGCEDVRPLGLHHQLSEAVKARFEFELAKRLEELASDKERWAFLDKYGVRIYADERGHFQESGGLIMHWEKFENIYIPRTWKKFMPDIRFPASLSQIGMLSADECILNVGLKEEHVFNETILILPSRSQRYCFVYYSDWRKMVMKYARWRLDHIKKNLETKQPGYKNDQQTKELVHLIAPLIDRYILELA